MVTGDDETGGGKVLRVVDPWDDATASGTELDLLPEDDRYAWDRLVRDVRGGSAAATPLVAALDAPVEPLLVDVDVDAALAAADDPDPDVRDPMRSTLTGARPAR